MSKVRINLIISLGLFVLLVISNGYWLKRTRTVRQNLTASKTWMSEQDNNSSEITAVDSVLLKRAVERANVPAERLPDRIEQYDKQVSDLNTKIGKIRSRWAKTWWKTLDGQRSESTPIVAALEIPEGETDDARELAIGAPEHGRAIALISTSNGSFAVGVADELTEEFSATTLASRIVEDAGGGSGGSATLATGGGSDPAVLADTIDSIAADIREEIA